MFEVKTKFFNYLWCWTQLCEGKVHSCPFIAAKLKMYLVLLRASTWCVVDPKEEKFANFEVSSFISLWMNSCSFHFLGILFSAHSISFSFHFLVVSFLANSILCSLDLIYNNMSLKWNDQEMEQLENGMSKKWNEQRIEWEINWTSRKGYNPDNLIF